MNRPDVMRLAMRSDWKTFVPRYSRMLVALQDEVQIPNRQHIAIRVLEWLLSRDDKASSRKHFFADLDVNQSTLLKALKHLRNRKYVRYQRSPHRQMNMLVPTEKLLSAADRCWEES